MTPRLWATALKSLVLLGVCAQAPAALADTYPSRAVRVVVPYPAGGGADAMARLAAERLQAHLKQPVLVDNKPGAGSVIGSDFVAKARPDGYTLLFNIPALVQAPLLQPSVPFDPVRDFVPITTFVSAPVWFSVNRTRLKATDFASFKDEAAKAQPKNRLEYGSWGPGTTNHLYGELLLKSLNLQAVHVAYKGSAPATLALASGETAFMLADYTTLRPHVEAGTVRILASTGVRRHRLTPDVPTLAELGYPGFESVGWAGFFAPKGTPNEVVAKLEAVIAEITREPQVIEKMASLGFEPGGKPQAEFAREVQGDVERWRRTIQAIGFKAD
ncbi:Bug family tripartite tricarboxylate transporter substrate binding protein [Hydrogenophaga sp.]|uniref:Bug family tripartite tricarboxylate transporter substrate binding protein n=1 Tax=Hydrogenophaga sp. TaxID=1904254 RepID=UPI0035ADFBA4